MHEKTHENMCVFTEFQIPVVRTLSLYLTRLFEVLRQFCTSSRDRLLQEQYTLRTIVDRRMYETSGLNGKMVLKATISSCYVCLK